MNNLSVHTIDKSIVVLYINEFDVIRVAKVHYERFGDYSLTLKTRSIFNPGKVIVFEILISSILLFF